MKGGLWSIVSVAERVPAEVEAERLEARDRALAVVVLSVDPTLLYLLRDTSDLVNEVPLKLSDQFQKKKWASNLTGWR